MSFAPAYNLGPQVAPLTVAPSPSPWNRMFTHVPREHGFEPLRVEGAIPHDLHGTLYRNGPARFGVGQERYGHWFDGDGALGAFRLAHGRAEGAYRFLDTVGIRKEQSAGRKLYGGFGTRRPGNLFHRLRHLTKNTANTSVMVWQGRIFALMEGALPVEVRPSDLTTIDESTFGDVILARFSAHPHYVPERKAAYNFGVRHGRKTMVDLYELPNTGHARRLTSIALEASSMIHDFIVTPRHIIFFAPPLRFRALHFLLGSKSFEENLQWRGDEGVEVIIVDIDDPKQVRRFTIESFFQWHFSNAFERGDELVVDLVRYPDFTNNLTIGRVPFGGSPTGLSGKFYRMTLRPKDGVASGEILFSRDCEFPRTSSLAVGRPYQHAFMTSAKDSSSSEGPIDALTRLNVMTGESQTVTLGARHYPGEPVVVRKANGRADDDAWVLSVTYDADADSSYLAILDGAKLDAGPVARVHMGHAMPLSFHGNWEARR